MSNLTIWLYVIGSVLVWFFMGGVAVKTRSLMGIEHRRPSEEEDSIILTTIFGPIALSILVGMVLPTILVHIARGAVGMVIKCKLPIAKIVDRKG